jgi:hypothetical protein
LGDAVAFARGLATGTVSIVASRLCDKDAICQSPRVLTKVENDVTVEPVGKFELKGIRRPLAQTRQSLVGLAALTARFLPQMMRR